MLMGLKTARLQAMCEQYRKPLEGEFSEDKVKVLELSLLDKALYVFMQKWIERNLKKAIPPTRHVCVCVCVHTGALYALILQSQFMVCAGKKVSELRTILDLHSSIVGYAYLLDRDGLIRWQAHATPTNEELQGMTKSAQSLLDT